jgi:hypothetical protein
MRRFLPFLALVLFALPVRAANNQLLASDSFTSGSLAAGWSAQYGYSECQVVSGSPNVTEANTTLAACGQVWTGLTFPGDQISEVTANLTSELTSYVVPMLRQSAGADTHYEADINFGAVIVYAKVAGVATQIGSTVTGLTFAPGDVWTFGISGQVLFVYQNGAKVFHGADTSIPPGGSPGYSLYAASDITHAQVLSWRGFSNIQQDGIWQKQGIVIPITAADIASSGYGTYQPSILHDGNARILSGLVYKMWFTGGGTSANIYYAESTDGKNWTRYGSAVLTGWSNGQVIKVGTTYYMYVQASASQGSGTIALFESTDGLSWGSAVSTTILAAGTGGAWDAGTFYVLASPVELSGTWYMLYIGGASGSNGLFKLGVATSTDLLTWTKHVGNPVLSNITASTPVNVGGTWYMWSSSGPTSPQQAGIQANYDPSEGMRYQSTDLLTWTNPVHSIHHSQMYESLNTPLGQAAPCYLIDVGGKAFMYEIGAPLDGSAPQDYQIALSIAPAPIAQVVLHNEDAAPQIASDAFTGGTGPLSANWTTPTGLGALQIVSGNLVEASSTSTLAVAGYSGASFSTSQYSEITIATLFTPDYYANPTVYTSLTANTSYGANVQGQTGDLESVYINQDVAGTQKHLGPTQLITLQVGDTIRLQVTPLAGVGNVLSLFQNGTLIQQVVDEKFSITSGVPGMLIYATLDVTRAQISSWAGGNADVIPTYSFGMVPTHHGRGWR